MIRTTALLVCLAVAVGTLSGCAAGPGHTRALGTLGGTATGAAIGSGYGPSGALAGGIIGLVAGTLAGDAIATDQERCCDCAPPCGTCCDPCCPPACPPPCPAPYTVVEEAPNKQTGTRVYHVYPSQPGYCPPPYHYYGR